MQIATITPWSIVTADHETGGLSLGAKDPAKYQAGVNPIFASGLIKIPGSKNNYTTSTVEATHTAPDVPIMAMGPGMQRRSATEGWTTPRYSAS